MRRLAHAAADLLELPPERRARSPDGSASRSSSTTSWTSSPRSATRARTSPSSSGGSCAAPTSSSPRRSGSSRRSGAHHPGAVLVRHGVDHAHFARALDPALRVPDDLAAAPAAGHRLLRPRGGLDRSRARAPRRRRLPARLGRRSSERSSPPPPRSRARRTSTSSGGSRLRASSRVLPRLRRRDHAVRAERARAGREPAQGARVRRGGAPERVHRPPGAPRDAGLHRRGDRRRVRRGGRRGARATGGRTRRAPRSCGARRGRRRSRTSRSTSSRPRRGAPRRARARRERLRAEQPA